MPCYAQAAAEDLMQTVNKYELFELSFQSQVNVKNPFLEYLLKLKLIAPDKRVFFVDGFYDGDGKGGQSGNVWKARFCPDQPGVWHWEAVAGDVVDLSLIGQSGNFKCVDTAAAGGVVANGKFFHLQNGEPIYLQGNFLDFSDNLVSTHVYMSQDIPDRMRKRILKRQTEQKVNKINIYFANEGDYGGLKVSPWLKNDKMQMDLKRWFMLNHYLLQFKQAGLFAEFWFFADDSGFGGLKQEEKNCLFRYAMARFSAYSNTFYVTALEWQEGWSLSSVRASGQFIQDHNPWKRLLSVHSLPIKKADSFRAYFQQIYMRIFGKVKYSDEGWCDFIASQAGNKASPQAVNSLAIENFRQEMIPHLSEEFGILKEEEDVTLMRKVWANFLGGAAGGGTGSNIPGLMNFIDRSQIPFHMMSPNNKICKRGGEKLFCSEQKKKNYLIYSMGNDIEIEIEGRNMVGYWYDPALPDDNFQKVENIIYPGNNNFSLPKDDKDWVLWITSRGI